MADALEMRAISATVGVEEGAMLALAAGADALCLGHDLEEEAVGTVRAAIVAAVRSGELAEERLAEAAARVASAGEWSRSHGDGAAPDRLVGLVAARRALRVEGSAILPGPAFVVECVPESTIAADPMQHGLGTLLTERDPRTESVRLDGAVADLASLAASANGRCLVVVVRDTQRHGWERSLAAELLALRPDAVVVDVGYPGRRPGHAAGYITTFGAGRANLIAAAERLLGVDAQVL